MLAIAWSLPANAAGGEDALYQVLYFQSRGKILVDEIVPEFEGGLTVESADEITDEEILSSDTLREAIGKYFDARATAKLWGRRKVEMDEIISMEILERSGDQVRLELAYFWTFGREGIGKQNRAEVFVQIIPIFTREPIPEERYDQPLVVEDAIFNVLHFSGGTDVRIDEGTRDVGAGLAIESVDQISDDEIIAADALRSALRSYFDVRATIARWGRRKVELDEFTSIGILARSGNHVSLEINYTWNSGTGAGRDRAEALVEIIPSFTNETYYEERYGQPLVIEDSYFPDVAGEFAALGLVRGYDEKACVHNYHAPHPCIESIPLFKAFAASHGFPLDLDTAWMFQAYVEGAYARGDRLYARAKGYELPKYEGIGNEVAALGLKSIWDGTFGEKRCFYNYYSPNPCPAFMEHWRAFAERHGLGLNRASADIFEAYAEGSYRQGDRLYRVARGIAEPGYVGPGTDVMALGFKPSMDLSRLCQHNPASPNRCVTSLEEFEEFAAKHDLPLDLNTADIFQSYVRHDVKRGDMLYARAKGIPVEALSDPELLEEITPLIIDVVPDAPAPTE